MIDRSETEGTINIMKILYTGISAILILLSTATFGASTQKSNLGLQRYNELALKILNRQFTGGKDDDSLSVQKELYKPSRGTMGSELEKQVLTDDSHDTNTD